MSNTDKILFTNIYEDKNLSNFSFIFKIVLFGPFFFTCLAHSKVLKKVTIPHILDEEAALDYIVEHNIPIISRETPENKELFKKKLRQWNPNVAEWSNLGSFEKINVYHQSPLYDLSIGYQNYISSETLDSGGVIETTNHGPTIDFRTTFINDLEFFTYINYRYLKKNLFTLDETGRSFSFPVNHNAELGFSFSNQFSRWSQNLAFSWEQFSYLSFNNERYKVRQVILRNLQVSTTEIYWAVASIDYRFTISGRGTYIRLAGGGSPYGKKSLDDGSKSEKVNSYKGYLSLKHYMYKSLWIKSYYQYAVTDGRTRTTQSQINIHTGFSF